MPVRKIVLVFCLLAACVLGAGVPSFAQNVLTLRVNQTAPLTVQAFWTFEPSLFGNACVTLSLDWGDGTPAETVSTTAFGSPSSGGPEVHVYSQPGTYTVTLECAAVPGDNVSKTITISRQAGDISRLELRFTQKRSDLPGAQQKALNKGRVSVPRNSTGLKALAEITYSGSLTLRGKWKVDGQILGYVTRQLYPGRTKITLESPDIPPFPTYDIGRHSVTFEITEPEPAFTEPTIYYFVTEQRGNEVLRSLALTSPGDRGRVVLKPSLNGPAQFQWASSPFGDGMYVFEIFDSSSNVFYLQGSPSDWQGTTIDKPVIRAKTRKTQYGISNYDISRLSPNVLYTWHVLAMDGREIAASSRYRTVFFTPPDPTKGGLSLQFINGGEGVEKTTTGTNTYLLPVNNNISFEIGFINDSEIMRRNIRVYLLVDEVRVDSAFIPYISAGETKSVTMNYYLGDDGEHDFDIHVFEGVGSESPEIKESGKFIPR